MTTGYAAPAAVGPIAAPRRSGWVTTAAVVLLASGALSALVGLIFLILGVAAGPAWTELVSGPPGLEERDLEAMSGFMTGFMVGLAIVTLAWAAAHVAAGVGILAGRGWARVTGMVVSVLGFLLSLLALVGTLASLGAASAMMIEDPTFQEQMGGYSAQELMGATIITSVVFIGPFVVGYLIALIALIRNGPFFDRPAALMAPPAA